MNLQPPRLPRILLEWIAGPARIDDLLGDLDEWFYHNAETHSLRHARRKYWQQAMSLSFSYAVRKRKRDAKSGPYYGNTVNIDMLRNYIKVAVRNLYQYKYFSILNAFGLAIGMSISLLLIGLYSYISTYDNFHAYKDRTYTITSNYRDGIEDIDYATSPLILAEKLHDEVPSAEKVLRIVKGHDLQVKNERTNIPVEAYYTEPAFFDVFSFPLVQGTPSALLKPNQVILTESAAIKFFNSIDVIGKTIELEGGRVLEVAAIMADPPRNTHLDFEMLVSLSSLAEGRRTVGEQWTKYERQYIYVLLKEGASRDDFQQHLDRISKNTYAQMKAHVTFEMQPIQDITMGADLRQSIGTKWDAVGLYSFMLFAALILLPACFNYTNISIARALRRAKEIGLRKTMGGVGSQIFLQFVTETIIITLLSLVGALLIFFLIRSEFQSMMVAGAKLDLSLTWRMFLMFLGFALTTGLLAGLFPALHFARLNPIQALKSKLDRRGSSMRIRKVLTVFQFALSFGFILSLVVFTRQYYYSKNFDFGFEKANTINIALQDVDPDQFRTTFAGLAPVEAISMSSGLPGIGAPRTWVHIENKDSLESAQLFVDHNFIANFGLTLLAGRNFPEGSPAQERFIIVNEEFLKANNISDPSAVLGRIFVIETLPLEVIGVLKNFHFEPLLYPIDKFLLRRDQSKFTYANLKVQPTDPYRLFTQFEAAWKTLGTEWKLEARFFEDELNEAYQSYTVLLKIVGFLGLLAITISLLGMLGMVVYTSESRTKEVSIRKVLGASAVSIVLILSKDYLKMMGWAIVVALPLTIFVLSKMLEQLQYYSVQLSFWDVIASTLLLLGLGVITISSQTWKTAGANPAETLKGD
jgi:putative ABC transport system permease protein